MFYFSLIFTLVWCSNTQYSRYELIISKMNKNIYPTNLLYSSKSFLGEFLKLLRLEESWNQRRWKRFGHGIYNVDSAKSRWCYDCTRNLKGDWNTFKKVNNFLLGLLLFQATSFIQKMIYSAFKKTDTHKCQYA